MLNAETLKQATQPAGHRQSRDFADRRLAFAMASFMSELDHPDLAKSWLIAAHDCLPRCPCPGCASVREEAAEARDRRRQRGMKRQGVA